jgi:hypothetical protein
MDRKKLASGAFSARDGARARLFKELPARR